jgi:hypothetical protein
MTSIVISYRREDSQGITGRIFDRLEGHYGQGHVFMDIDNIPYGIDFREHLQETLNRCDILIVVVGPRWFGLNEEGQPRLFEEADWVRIEVGSALAKKVPVVPLLVEGARMPKPNELPEDLRGFAFRQAATLDTGVDFRVHMERLIKSMDRVLALKNAPAKPEITVTSDEKRKHQLSGLDQKSIPIEKRPIQETQTEVHVAESQYLHRSTFSDERHASEKQHTSTWVATTVAILGPVVALALIVAFALNFH